LRQPLLKEALEHHRAGRFDEAERLYGRILTTQPDDADALHLLGLIATSRHRYETAGPLIARALAVKPDRADFHASLGNLFYARGQVDEMVACYRRALLLSHFHAIPASFADIAARAGSEPSAADFSTDIDKYKSQYLQDVVLDRWLFEGMSGGTFMDIGAHDGIKLSNTYFFEAVRGWRGICIEPNPKAFAELSANRTCATLNCCISGRPGTVPFLQISGYPEMLSGIVYNYEPAHRARIEQEIAQFGGSSDVIPIPARTLNDIAAEAGFADIDYLSIDTEGSELAILEATDFRALFVHAVTVECNFDAVRARMMSLMDERGFDMTQTLGHDLLFINRSSARYARFKDLRTA